MPEDMGAVGLAEAPATETGSETVETQVETGAEDGVDTGDSNEVDSSGANKDLTGKTPVKTKLNLSEVAKSKADALKAIDPALPGTLRAAAYELNGFLKEFPAGVKEATALKATLGEFGGVEGIKETTQAYAE